MIVIFISDLLPFFSIITVFTFILAMLGTTHKINYNKVKF